MSVWGTRRSDHRPHLLVVVAMGLVLELTACGFSSGKGPEDVAAARQSRQQAETTVAVSAQSAATAAVKCDRGPEADASFPALAGFPSGSFAAQIRGRGQLVVGVSGDTRLLGYRDSLNGGDLKGFDIELAKAIGKAIFGVDGKVQFKVITAGQRFDLVNKSVEEDGVDLVARAVSMTCDRWANPDPTKSSAFSAAYFTSAQKLLVRKDLGVASIDRLAKGSLVCAPTGSTSLANLAAHPNVTPVAAEIHSDCLALWQEGRVDAITGDDAILAGFAAQDPHAAVVGPSMDTTSYGFAIGKQHLDFVQFVNAVMAGSNFRAIWAKAYGQYLADRLGLQLQPVPNYSRPLTAR